MELNNKVVLERANAAVTAGDYERFLSFCTNDTEWNFVGDRILKGKDAVRQYMSEVYLEPPRFTVENLIAEGEFVTAMGEISMKDISGTWLDYFYCDVWRFRDGKMVALKAFVIQQKTEAL